MKERKERGDELAVSTTGVYKEGKRERNNTAGRGEITNDRGEKNVRNTDAEMNTGGGRQREKEGEMNGREQ